MARKQPKVVKEDDAFIPDALRFVPKNETQRQAWHEIMTNDYTFLTGIAGSGKTRIAMACGVEGLLCGEFEKIILTRPAVEAGENLGFLPGTMTEKMKPFLMPVFDSIDKIAKDCEAIKRRIMASVEIVPLAYARGRTFENCFCVLDEAQNAEAEAIEMYMTRLGIGSKMVLCGDDGQPDIIRCVLGDVAQAFHAERQAGWQNFTDKDSVRHPRIAHVIRIMSKFKQRRRK